MRILLNQRFGLGNQLFQYAAALYYSEKYNAPLEMIREREETAHSYGHARPFLLSHFSVTTPVRERNMLDRVLRSKSRAVALLAAPVRRLSGTYSYDPDFRVIGEFRPELELPKGTRRVYLNGHFQAHQYAQAMEARLRRELRFREAPKGKNLEMSDQIRQCPCPVSLHVRLGDYVIEWDGRNLLPVTYYVAAIERMRALHPDATFFVFSDDIVSARARLPAIEGAIFVNHNTQATPHEDLRLMSLCRHHILANSTFSWWGAWLDESQEKTVLAPDPWHRSDPHPDLLPPEWNRVSSSAGQACEPTHVQRL